MIVYEAIKSIIPPYPSAQLKDTSSYPQEIGNPARSRNGSYNPFGLYRYV